MWGQKVAQSGWSCGERQGPDLGVETPKLQVGLCWRPLGGQGGPHETRGYWGVGELSEEPRGGGGGRRVNDRGGAPGRSLVTPMSFNSGKGEAAEA